MSQEKPLPTLRPSRFHDRELWVGVFVILGVSAVLIALFTLTDATLFRGRYILLTEVGDAGGIRRGDPVQMRGVNIGRITRFQIVPAGVMVSLEIKGNYSVPSDSRVELRSTGLLGGMVANVIPGVSVENAQWGDALPGSVGKGVFDQADELQQQVSQALTQAQRLVDENTIRNVHEGGDDLRKLLRQLEEITTEQRGEFAALTRSLRGTAETLEQTVASPEIDRSMKGIDALIKKLDGIASSLDHSARSAENILTRVDQGEGSLGKLTRDETLYDNISEAAASVKKAAEEFASLAADIQAQPKKYVELSLF